MSTPGHPDEEALTQAYTGDSEDLRRVIDSTFGTDAAHGLVATRLTERGWVGPRTKAALSRRQQTPADVSLTDILAVEARLEALTDAVGLLELSLSDDGLLSDGQGGDHGYEVNLDGDGWNEPFSARYSCICGAWSIEWCQSDREQTGRPNPVEALLGWRAHFLVASGEVADPSGPTFPAPASSEDSADPRSVLADLDAEVAERRASRSGIGPDDIEAYTHFTAGLSEAADRLRRALAVNLLHD